MKLLTKYNQVNIAATVTILLLSGVVFYFFIEAALIHQLDKTLIQEEKEITAFIKENNRLPEPNDSKEEQETYTPAGNQPIYRSFQSVTAHYENNKRERLYRQLEFAVAADGRLYRADVRKSQVETEDVIQLVSKITLAIVILLLAVLFVISRLILNKLWKPFQVTLQQIKAFNVSMKDSVQLPSTTINEFAELIEAVEQMTQKAKKDYQEIKSFTENASHEIQTPLAIIASKIELLSQSDNLKEDQMHTIQSIAETTNRLAKLNQSLILLTKIDNRQFGATTPVDVSRMVLQILYNYEELFLSRSIQIKQQIDPGVKQTMNEALAEILIINLLTNSFRHNVENGSVTVILQDKYLSISNTGNAISTLPELLFERFRKEAVSSESMGLGLSIVKKICDIYHFKVTYQYQNLLHTITIHFS